MCQFDGAGNRGRCRPGWAEIVQVQRFHMPAELIRHVSHFIEVNDSISLVHLATAAPSQAAPQRARAVSACKVKVMEAARSVAGAAVHFHSGIGVAAEFVIGQYLHRVLVSEQMFGNCQHHSEPCLAHAA